MVQKEIFVGYEI